jgi:cysteine desulfurase / selenocysteine lyase
MSIPTHTSNPVNVLDVAMLERLANEFFSGGAIANVASNPAPAGSPLAGPGGTGTGVPGAAIPQGKVPGANLAPSSPLHVLSLGNRAPALVPHAESHDGVPDLVQSVAPALDPRFGGAVLGTEPVVSGYYFLNEGGQPSSRRGDVSSPVTPESFGLPGDDFLRTLALESRNRPDATHARSPFDINAIRRDFPILQERVNGKQLVWFDNAATTQKPQAVIDRLAYFYAHENSNIHRAAHTIAGRATDAYEGARDTVRRFLNAASTDEIIFVRGTTEGINLIAKSWGVKNVGEGDEIIVSNLEYQRMLNGRVKIVSVTQVSNALGTVVPVQEIVAMAHRAGARALVDGAQSVSHMRVDVQQIDADFFVFSGHKIFGPTGIGAVYGKRDVLEDMPPWEGGGNMIQDVTFERTVFQGPPNRFEAGTGNIADAVGLGAALDYVTRIGIEHIGRYEHDLLAYATNLLAPIPGVRLIGTAKDKASVLSFVLKGYETEAVGRALNEEGIAVRSGHHCAQPILRRFGVEATVRPSLAFYNTRDEVDRFISVVKHLSGRR